MDRRAFIEALGGLATATLAVDDLAQFHLKTTQSDFEIGGDTERFNLVGKVKQAKPSEPPTTAEPRVAWYFEDDSHWSVAGMWAGHSKRRIIDHLLNGSAHKGKFDRKWLEGLTVNQLLTLHDHDHEGSVDWRYVNGYIKRREFEAWNTNRQAVTTTKAKAYCPT